MFGRQRDDGIMPQMCPPPDVSLQPSDPPGACNYVRLLLPPCARRPADSNSFDLQGQYCNDTVGAPGWHECQDLDSAAFATKFAFHIWTHSEAAEAEALYKRWGKSHEHCGRLGCVF